MGILRDTKVYLIGVIEQADKSDLSWRDDIQAMLEGIGVKVYNPLIKRSWYPEVTKQNPKIYTEALLGNSSDMTVTQAYDAMKFIVDIDLRFVHSSDWIICYLPKIFSAGSLHELTVAANTGKPILIFGPHKFPSSWLVPILSTPDTYNEVFFDSIEKVKEHILKIDNNTIELDPKQWCFLSYFNDNIKLKGNNV